MHTRFSQGMTHGASTIMGSFIYSVFAFFFFFSSRRRHTRFKCDWSSDVCSSDLAPGSGLPMNIQALDLVEIGAGGGSIARARLGVIAVGPESASSTPGPVCYGRGGAEPTVTDADVVLGYINPDYFAGGSLKLRPDAAAPAIEEQLARPLRLPLAEAAWGGHPIVNTHLELPPPVVSPDP